MSAMNETLLDRAGVAALCSIPAKSNTLELLLKADGFPPPVYLTPKRPRWFAAEVVDYLKARRERQIGGPHLSRLAKSSALGR